MERKLIEKIVMEGGLAVESRKFLEMIEEKGIWGTNEPDFPKFDFYRSRGIVRVKESYDDQLSPPKLFELKLTPLGEEVLAYLKGK